MSRAAVLLALTTPLLACSQAPPAPPPVAPPPAVLSPPAATASQVPVADVGARPPAPERFFPALVYGGHLDLRAIDNTILALVFSGRNSDQLSFAVAESDDIVLHPELSKGLPPTWPARLEHLVGRLPAPLWMVTRTFDDSHAAVQNFDDILRFGDGGWKSVERAAPDLLYKVVWESPEGCLVGMQGEGDWSATLSPFSMKIRAIDCKGRIPVLPAPRRSTLIRHYNYVQARGLPNGDLYTIVTASWGFTAASSTGDKLPPLLEIWKHDQRKTTQVPFPADIAERTAYATTHLLVRSVAEVYVAADRRDPSDRNSSTGLPTGDPSKWIPPFLLRFDGATWSQMPTPPVTAIADIQFASDGSLLLTGRSLGKYLGDPEEIWGMKPGAAWERLGSIPIDPHAREPRAATKICGRSLDDVWVLGSARDGDIVFHNRPPKSGAPLKL